MGSFPSLFKYFRAAGLARKGRRLLARGDCEDAIDLLGKALALLGREQPRGATFGVWFSERVVALRDLSYAAAKAGNITLARASIEEGLALWDSGGLGPDPKYQAMDEWGAWARDYMVRSGAGRSS